MIDKRFLLFMCVINLALSLIGFSVLFTQNESLAKSNIQSARKTQELIEDNQRMREEINLYKNWCKDMIFALEEEKL